MRANELFSLSGKHVIVSGGSGLLAPHFARALLSAGALVTLIDKNAAGLDHILRALLSEFPGQVMGHQCDLTNESEVKAVVERCDLTHGLYGLVNAAALDAKADSEDKTILDNNFTRYSLERWRACLDVNVTGTFLLTREVCKFLEPKSEGSIVNLSSTYGLVAPDQSLYSDGCPGTGFRKPGDYATSKAAIVGFTKYLAAYYAGTKIRVNCLVPGGVLNDHSEDFVVAYSRRTLLGRMAVPSDFAGALIYLISDASSYVTGLNLIVDGGWTSI